MGKAIVIPGVSFAALGMGQVTIQGGEIVVTGAAVIIGTQYSGFAASISNVVWSVGSDEYATIDESTGALTIKSGAFGHEVVVRATKADNPYQSGELTVKVYYSALDTATFSEVTVIDVTTNLRDGSPGNPSNTMRVCPTNTISVDGQSVLCQCAAVDISRRYYNQW